MAQACRNALMEVQVSRAAHAGLVLDSYLREQGEKAKDVRKGLMDAARAAAGNAKDLYAKAYARWRLSLDASGGTVVKSQVKTASRLITGLGIETVLETGLRLHHTFGTPIIPGSSLKGVTSHYCAEVWAERDSAFAEGGDTHKTLFGSEEDKGFITFHDAWILPGSLPSALVEDVMTPHYSSYYGGTGAPTDTADPIPIAFLSVRGVFLLAVACEDSSEKGKGWAELAMALCKAALADWGAGGKTAAGYGRMLQG